MEEADSVRARGGVPPDNQWQQLAVDQLLRPDMYVVPGDGLWERYEPEEVRRRTRYIPLAVLREKTKEVGFMLEEISGGNDAIQGELGVVLLVSNFSEKRMAVSLEDELRLYNDVLEVIRAECDGKAVLVKTHPRVSYAKMAQMEMICAKQGAMLQIQQQLVEYMLEKTGRCDVLVVGPPSTALVNTLCFGYGKAFCLSQHLIASYVGQDYTADHWMTKDHAFMETAGVGTVGSLRELRQLLRGRHSQLE